MMNSGNGQLAVPPGFRFHPTDEELVYYYLRKKVAYEAIDLDVIRDVDLNKLEPWDLNEKCRIGTGPQNEWYFFSHKDKKYPTGTRTNRATTAGFWKATGRDKAIHVSGNSKRIGMRKTLVFYTGRAPHGHKTDWIMHEYRLLHTHHQPADPHLHQEEGWVVCRVFKKKNLQKCNSSIPSELIFRGSAAGCSSFPQPHEFHGGYSNIINTHHPGLDFSSFDNPAAAINMHLPQLLSAEQAPACVVPNFVPQSSNINTVVDLECSHNLMMLTTSGICGSGGGGSGFPAEKMAGDWSISLEQFCNGKWAGMSTNNNTTTSAAQQFRETTTGSSSAHQRLFPLQYLGCETDLLKFCKEG